MSDPERQSTLDRMYETFRDTDTRLPFIRKVYGIMLIQLLITFAFVVILIFVDEFRKFVFQTPALFWSAIGVTIAVSIVISCCGDILRKFPLNYIALFIFALCEAYMVGIGTFPSSSITMAVTLVIILQNFWVLILFTLQSKYNFTWKTGLLIPLFVSLTMFGCLMRFGISGPLPQSYIKQMGFATLGAFLFSTYIVVVTLLILKGEYIIVLSPKEYAFATLNLNLALVNLVIAACKNGCKAVSI